jgi:TolB-like protein
MNITIRALLKVISFFISVILLASCSSVNESTRLCADDRGDFYQCTDVEIVEHKADKPSHDFQSERSFQTINEYTEQMVYQLSKKLSTKKIERTIMVPPFASLSNIHTSNPHLAVDIAEAFIIDLQNIGLPASELLVANTSIDYQADYLTYLDELSGNDDIGYIVKGTMRETANGVMLYARVINVNNRKVIASASKLLPFYLIK